MKLKDVYGRNSGITQNMKTKVVGMPFPTVQKGINQKPPLASKFLKKVGKKYKKASVGLVPRDMKERFQQPIPPIPGDKVAK